MKSKNLFIVWHDYQARVDSMKGFFGYEIKYIGSKRKNKLMNYLMKSLKTVITLFKNKPTTVWIQLPPTPLLYLMFAYKKINKITLIADCHNGMLRKPWINFPFATKILNSTSDLIIVHNEDVYNEALTLGIQEHKCMVLEDKASEIEGNKFQNSNVNLESPSILFPASFNIDEPIKLLLEVATKLPEFTFYITGNTKRASKYHNIENAPENVIFTGWIEKEEYHNIFEAVDIVLGLTLYENIQLSVANEAVGFQKPMVLSNTHTLQKLFHKGAVYTAPESKEMVNSILKAYSEKDSLKDEMIELKQERNSNWLVTAKTVLSVVEK
ncbi:glycosyltransferase [Guptibacillus hwajinpoensis]|uniref:glycosyltransferase n=1 Tax=Guptibacillus hwajinpoensis TaxID=208199 RepID=UPI001CFD5375|nr:glycosyltransferase [Pseudalkalibacillus hwajinpoensis]WLR61833.1 glycosyltransferase [Pseudalkalibacillus hwajinpoensis]